VKVLIVEDNASMRRLIRSIVGDLANSVAECADGEGALAAYAACEPDWVLMDIRMPGVDGLTATRQIVARYPEAKVMIVTENDRPQTRAAALACGAREFLSKDYLYDLRRLLAAREQ